MPNRDDELETKTHKGLEPTARRVWYTLTPDNTGNPPTPDLSRVHAQSDNSARVLSQLIELLEKRGILSADDIDELLLPNV